MTEYKLIRSDRKTLAIEITGAGELLVRAPRRLSAVRIERFLTEKQDWIAAHRALAEQRAALPERQPVSAEERERLFREAERILPERVRYWSERMGLKPTGIRITGAEKRFGSCSSENSLCFSYRLMRYPMEAVDYVAVHELAHIRHHNHSKDFYALVARYLPDYREREAILRGAHPNQQQK